MNVILEYCKEAKSAKEIREHLNINSRRYTNYYILKPLIELGYLEYTNKDYIRASNQKYITRKH